MEDFWCSRNEAAIHKFAMPPQQHPHRPAWMYMQWRRSIDKWPAADPSAPYNWTKRAEKARLNFEELHQQEENDDEHKYLDIIPTIEEEHSQEHSEEVVAPSPKASTPALPRSRDNPRTPARSSGLGPGRSTSSAKRQTSRGPGSASKSPSRGSRDPKRRRTGDQSDLQPHARDARPSEDSDIGAARVANEDVELLIAPGMNKSSENAGIPAIQLPLRLSPNPGSQISQAALSISRQASSVAQRRVSAPAQHVPAHPQARLSSTPMPNQQRTHQHATSPQGVNAGMPTFGAGTGVRDLDSTSAPSTGDRSPGPRNSVSRPQTPLLSPRTAGQKDAQLLASMLGVGHGLPTPSSNRKQAPSPVPGTGQSPLSAQQVAAKSGLGHSLRTPSPAVQQASARSVNTGQSGKRPMNLFIEGTPTPSPEPTSELNPIPAPRTIYLEDNPQKSLAMSRSMREKAQLERAGVPANSPATTTASSHASADDPMDLDSPVAESDEAQVQADLEAQRNREAERTRVAAAAEEAKKKAKEEAKLLKARKQQENEARIAADKLEKAKEAAAAEESERKAKEKAELLRKAREKAESERKAKEEAELLEARKQQENQARIAADKLEKARIEQEELKAREKREQDATQPALPSTQPLPCGMFHPDHLHPVNLIYCPDEHKRNAKGTPDEVKLDGLSLTIASMHGAFSELVRSMQDVLQRQNSAPQDTGTGTDVFTQIDVQALLLQPESSIPDVMAELPFDVQKRQIQKFQINADGHNLQKKVFDSFLYDVAEARATNITKHKIKNENIANAIQEMGQWPTSVRTPSARDEHLRYWKNLSRLRNGGCRILLMFRDHQVDAILRKDKSTETVMKWEPVLVKIYRRLRDQYMGRKAGESRGLESIPESVNLPELRDSWSNEGGRWSSMPSAAHFAAVEGTPSQRHTLPATPPCTELGYFGDVAVNQADGVALFQTVTAAKDGNTSPSRLSAVAIVNMNAGDVLGVCPHTTSIQSNQAKTDTHRHIYCRHPSIEYKHDEILGVLSFVQYVSRNEDANARLASDMYTDSILPCIYSFRVLVIATRPILALETIKVHAGKNASTLNHAVQTAISGRATRRGAADRAQAEPGYAVRYGDIAQALYYFESRDGKDKATANRHLRETYYEPYLSQGFEDTVLVSAADMGRILEIPRARLDSEPHILHYEKHYEEHKKQMRKRGIPVESLSLAQYAEVCMKCSTMAPRKKGSLREPPSVAQAVVRPPRPPHGPLVRTLPKGVSCGPALGHLAVVLRLLLYVEPIVDGLANNNFVTSDDRDWTQALVFGTGHCLTSQLQTYAAVVKLGEVIDHMLQDDPSGSVSEEVVTRLADALDRVFRTSKPQRLSDPSETYDRVHQMLQEALTTEPGFGDHPQAIGPFLGVATRSSDNEHICATASRFNSMLTRDGRKPVLAGKTVGIEVTELLCASSICEKVQEARFTPISQIFVQLPQIPDTEITLVEAVKNTLTKYGEVSLQERCVCLCQTGNFKTRLASLPDYLVLTVMRAQPHNVKNSVKVKLPHDMFIDLGCVSVLSGSSNAVYEIVYTVEHRGDKTTEGAYVSFAKHEDCWHLMQRGAVILCDENMVKAHPSSVYMVLLKLLKKKGC